ncbi:unnamed protein product [Kluyveromyces dobzhanskii CBS 2104]|uniref:WGS project CCBQ000000000 data, contig 00058 n=1 Tax=Kluyveromyces dobzhanskii CBS 2104 TaxID=1427455 RepID=A0A0A8LCD3_9SACH|nr:unnamed protein product [Kluyveromyces dobzhanskii CBS 2104]
MRDPLISIEEVGRHTSRADCWTVIHGKVYDITSFLHKHPGGAQVLLKYAGKDATLQFDDVGHSMESLAYDLDPEALKGSLYLPYSKSAHKKDIGNDFVMPFFSTTIVLPSSLFWLNDIYQTVRKFFFLAQDTRIWLFSTIIFCCVFSLVFIRWGHNHNVIDNNDYRVPAWMD